MQLFFDKCGKTSRDSNLLFVYTLWKENQAHLQRKRNAEISHKDGTGIFFLAWLVGEFAEQVFFSVPGKGSFFIFFFLLLLTDLHCQAIIQAGSFSGKLATAKTPWCRMYLTAVGRRISSSHHFKVVFILFIYYFLLLTDLNSQAII